MADSTHVDEPVSDDPERVRAPEDFADKVEVRYSPMPGDTHARTALSDVPLALIITEGMRAHYGLPEIAMLDVPALFMRDAADIVMTWAGFAAGEQPLAAGERVTMPNVEPPVMLRLDEWTTLAPKPVLVLVIEAVDVTCAGCGGDIFTYDGDVHGHEVPEA